MTRDILGKERSPWGKVLISPVLPVAQYVEYLGLSALVTFHTWCITLTWLMPI